MNSDVSFNAPKFDGKSSAQLREKVTVLSKMASKTRAAVIAQGGTKKAISLVVMSDQKRLPRPDQIIAHLPQGSVFIFRDYALKNREEVAYALRALAKRQRIFFFVAGDMGLACRVNADGLHVPSHLLSQPGRIDVCRGRARRWMISAACHNQVDLLRARDFRADFALLSPVWPTQSHPGERALGLAKLKVLARAADMPVIALGGINLRNMQRLQGRNIQGIAGISMYSMG